MTAIRDLRILWSLLRGHRRSGDHAADLSAFYGGQAADYDAFRERLLPGRQELFDKLAARLPAHAHLVELGAGTGRNLAWLGERVGALSRVDLVDLCPPLLDRAATRWKEQPHVHCHLADATQWRPHAPCDAVVLAYSLTMMPAWQTALDNALSILKPGGWLAIVDFTLVRSDPVLARIFWRYWFGHDGVRLDAAHGEWLRAHCPEHSAFLERARLPYLPFVRPAYYVFLGRRPEVSLAERLPSL